MSRKYEKVSELLPNIKDLTAQGKTQQQIAEQLGLANKKVVWNLLYRERQNLEIGNIPIIYNKPVPLFLHKPLSLYDRHIDLLLAVFTKETLSLNDLLCGTMVISRAKVFQQRSTKFGSFGVFLAGNSWENSTKFGIPSLAHKIKRRPLDYKNQRPSFFIE